MKIDRADPRHWLWLAGQGLTALLALALRWLPRRAPREVFLYGHQLNGNLLALLRESQHAPVPGLALTFLTLDVDAYRALATRGEPVCLACDPRNAPRLARAAAIVSDHGLHALAPLVRFGRVPAFDVWHGIPFKGFDADDFTVQRRYDEAWVASPLLARLYVERFGFDPARVVATGYARTDALVAPREDVEAVRERLGLAHTRGRRLVLFAPTWRQDAAGRSIFPFGASAETFFAALEAACADTDALVLFRAHLNTRELPASLGARVVPVPQARFPDTEEILRLADVLVCDWSSIAFDFLLLDRPTVFLDVPAPFAKGFSLGPEYRFGQIVPDVAALQSALAAALRDPAAWFARHGDTHARVKAEVYGDRADGRAASRCLGRLPR
jgi:CDP-glycerol glycerophosphotransferase (TagB/SpsB family)